MLAIYPLLLHVVACGWYYFFWDQFLKAGNGNSKNWNPKYRDVNEMGYRFLTNWNLFMQTLYFIGCLLHDIMKILNGPNWLKIGSKIQMLISGSFAALILPTSIFVSTSFWILYGIDREIVYPKVIDDVLPYWQNHGMHTVILLLGICELFTTKHLFFSTKILLSVLGAFELTYAIVFLETYVEKGRWVYPLFGMFSLPISIAIMITLLFSYTMCLFVGIFIQNQYWEKEEKKNI
ncbi:androgen-dependent TFPI-regulating protein-like [Daktulosphaira vitifoliae]|uniref:androgen-dependent TFPI-regulating protein-like n=1 Tax=Daktulosphaira vitifoliae TaxID=58002 RepID=UPI0021A99C60|nr:androgen-dependent TFPI-regulating protein-like [Daktulosphaira vitifoliae]